MPYIICDKCGGYYELPPGESPKSFYSKCECGGNIRYIQDLNNADKFQKICLKCGSLIDANKKCPVCGFNDGPSFRRAFFKISYWVFATDLVIGVGLATLSNRALHTPFPKDIYSCIVLSSIVFLILIGVIVYVKRFKTNT